MSGAGKVVCVTGASGYIASWLVKLLLEKGYTVKATVRDLKDPKKTAHLLGLEGAKERLRLFEANLTQEGAFDHAVDGCEGVFHTASPVALSVTDPQGELIGPAVQGTLNVLKSCARIPSIRRVVLTSSMAAVIVTGKPLRSNPVIDETWFSDPKICEEAKLWYQVSKTLAEKAAWEFAKENGIDLVTINPGYVIGPLLQPTLNLTSVGMLNLIKSGATSIGFQSDSSKGHELFSDAMHRFVDVRDVASAHIKALDNPTASGRYCLVNQVSYLSETLKILHRLFPDLNLSERYNNDKTPVVPSYQVSKEKAKALGIEFISLEVSLKDAVESFMEKGFLVA